MKWVTGSLLINLSTAFSASTSSSSSSSVSSTSSVWSDVELGPPDAILGIAQAFRESQDPNKVNLCVGAYRDDTGMPWVLPTVQAAEERILAAQQDKSGNKEYLPIEGDALFTDLATTFSFGKNNKPILASVQSLSGTGACRIGGEFLNRFYPNKNIYIPVPTWGNHFKIFREAGLNCQTYRYYSGSSLEFDGLTADLRAASNGSILLLHACAHNPTGCDPTREQWKEIAQLCQEKQFLVFFDSAYQGFASGDPEADAWALRYFVDQGIPVMLAQSFAKNFGLYGERCGTLSIVCDSEEERTNILSQLKNIVRPMYSSPPRHGSSIVKAVLSDETLTSQYGEECQQMADRMLDMRQKLVSELTAVGSTRDWSHILRQIGMFAFTGISEEQCNRLTDDYSIYMTKDGRISLAGLNDANLNYVASALHDVTRD